MSWEEFCRLHEVGPMLRNASLDTSTLIDPKIIAFGKEWVKNPTKSLYIIGDCGTGKTHFSYCLMRALLEKVPLADLYSIKSKNLDDRLLYDALEYKSCKYFVDNMSTIRYLFIDDFGMEKDTDKSEKEYYEIIDRRVSHQLPTVFTTNMALEAIRKRLGTRISSRLKTFLPIPFSGRDIRETL